MRKVIAVALSLAVQGAALTGPLVHAHPDEHATAHHDGRAVHTHWAAHGQHPHPTGLPAVRTHDRDRAVFLNAFVAVAASLVSPVGVTHGLLEVPIPAESRAQRDIVVVRSHDPPFTARLSSRAPPAFLS